MNRHILSITLGLMVSATAFAQSERQPPNKDADKTEIRVFYLQNIVADEGADMLSTILLDSQDKPKIAVDSRLNALIVHGTQDRLRTIEALLLKLDADAASQQEDAVTRLFRLQHARATAISRLLQTMLTSKAADGHAIRLGVDENSNSIIVSAPEETQSRVSELLQQLDTSAQLRSATPATSLRFEILWIGNGESPSKLPSDISRILTDQAEQLGITTPSVLASAMVSAYVGGEESENRISVRNVKASDGTELDCMAKIAALDEEHFLLDLSLQVGAKSRTSIQTTIRTTLGHPVFVCSTTTSNESSQPTVFVLKLSN